MDPTAVAFFCVVYVLNCTWLGFFPFAGTLNPDAVVLPVATPFDGAVDDGFLVAADASAAPRLGLAEDDLIPFERPCGGLVVGLADG